MQGLSALKRRINAITRTIETKSGVRQITDGTEYLHNALYTVSIFKTKTKNFGFCPLFPC